MRKAWKGIGLATAMALLAGVAGRSEAALITVAWSADSSNDGMGSGLLGATTVTYTSAPGFNSGVTFSGQDWATFAGTDGATGGSVTSQTTGALGGSTTGTTQTITFSSAVDNPILLVNFLDGSDVFNFGANAFTLLDSNNITLNGNLIIGSGSVADTANDGFAVQFAGTYGPGSDLVFFFSTNGAGTDGLQTVGFTIGVAPTAVPEPATFASAGLAAAAGLVALRRRYKAVI